MENTENTNNQQQEDKDKIKKNFNTAMTKLVAIVGGEENLFPKKKIKKDTLATIVEGLVKEEKEALETSIKTEIKELLSKHVTLIKEVKAKEDELNKLKQTKQKEFTEAASKLFNKIENMDQLEKAYYESLKGATEQN